MGQVLGNWGPRVRDMDLCIRILPPNICQDWRSCVRVLRVILDKQDAAGDKRKSKVVLVSTLLMPRLV
eukprot:scaffold65138_cov22-Tisochrysis_lutea.AAC.1